VADKLEISASIVSRIETAQVGVRTNDLRPLLDLYKVTGEQREQLLQLARERRQQPWWSEYKTLPAAQLSSLERGTEAILQFSVQLVPGLLQTEAYAREVLNALPAMADLDTERRVELRIHRQELLTEAQAPRLWAVLDERSCGDPSVGNRSWPSSSSV
jgi:hypothetical protein